MYLNKNICFVFFLFIVVSNSLIAQKYYEVSFEIIGGVHYSYYSETNSPHLWTPYEGKLGFNIGGGYTYRATQLWALHIEVIYSNKTIQRSINNDYIKQKLNYLDIPLLLQFNISPNSNINTLLNFGPYLSFLIKHEYESSFPNSVSSFYPNDFDYGLLIGGGLGFLIDKYEVGIEIRYHLGLGDISDYTYENEGSNITSDVDGKLNSLVLLLKFGFNFLPNDD